MGKQSHGSTSKKAFVAPASRVLASLFVSLGLPTFSAPVQPKSLLAAVDLPVPSFSEVLLGHHLLLQGKEITWKPVQQLEHNFLKETERFFFLTLKK